MRLLSINATFSRLPTVIGATQKLIYERGFRPNAITVSSAAAFVIVPMILGRHRQLLDLVVNLRPADWFDHNPFKASGRPSNRTLWRLLWGAKSMTSNAIVRKYLDDLVGHDGFEYYKSPGFPSVVVSLMDMKTGVNKLFDLKSVSYSEYRDIVMASCSPPVWCKPVVVRGSAYCDAIQSVTSAPAMMFRQLPITQSIEICAFQNAGQTVDNSFSGSLNRMAQGAFVSAQWMRNILTHDEARHRDVNHVDITLEQADTDMADIDADVMMRHYREGGDQMLATLGDVEFWDVALGDKLEGGR